MKLKIYIIGLMLIMSSLLLDVHAQKKSIESILSDSLTKIANTYAAVGKITIQNINVDKFDSIITVVTNENFSQIPFRQQNVNRIYAVLEKVLSKKNPGFSIVCQSNNKNIEDLIPNYYRENSIDNSKKYNVVPLQYSLITNLTRPFDIKYGLENRHLAVWQSHGWYYNQSKTRWEWQRPRLFQTVEDLYTQSYILPFLVPMLENAGANVLIPRERDTNKNESIVDNDKHSEGHYHEINDRKSWKTAKEGFANLQKTYLFAENPFRMGTYKYISSINIDDELSTAEWIPNIKKDAYYAVYVSYKSVPKSVTDARYTVYHAGGISKFSINQSIGGGTWIYLGSFKFEKGQKSKYKVSLSNLSKESDKIVTADAVKFGGGMGNIARKPSDEIIAAKKEVIENSIGGASIPELIKNFKAETSNYPRFVEAARYWMQWAGIPDSIYSKNNNQNDYSDDFHSRGNWVNYLIGGTAAYPNYKGLGIPVDMALSFHTDAGYTANDSIIGTLGICTVQNTLGFSTYENGISRWAARDLTDIVQTQIVDDVRKSFAPEWVRRGLWNKSYSESRVAEVPSMLLELLSHQNFADMRYGLDPRFRFTVSRAIYKGVLKYLSFNSGIKYVVQPLPVESFSTRFIAKNKVELQWNEVVDSLESTAKAKQFVVYTRINNGGFNNGLVTKNNKIVLEIQTGKIYSFKITAINDGGESFPSEILSVYRAPNASNEVLIVNGFDRVSGPTSYTSNGATAGFDTDDYMGVPYISDISFVGKQYENQRKKQFVSNDSPGFGASNANYEKDVVAGNTFDYPYTHGLAIKAGGYSFISCSAKALMQGDFDIKKVQTIDLILGKQKQSHIGNAKKMPEFKTFPLALQQRLTNFCKQGGNLLISGSYIASDFYNDNFIKSDERVFLENVLKIKFQSSKAAVNGNVKIVSSPLLSFMKSDFSFYIQPNEISYHVDSPDAIEPAINSAYSICRYSENNFSAGVAYNGSYKTVCFGFPFETITSEKERNKLMASILNFFSKKSKVSIL